MSLLFWKKSSTKTKSKQYQPYHKVPIVRKGYLWDVIPNAKVPCRSIGEMRAYLTNTFEQWAGYPIVKFWVDNREDIIWAWVETPRGRRKIFFGYIEDIAHNIQHGLYEPKGK
jgi:hypothetical protein